MAKVSWTGIVAVILALALILTVWRSTSQTSAAELQVTGNEDMMVPPDQAVVYVYAETTAKTSLDSQQQNAKVSSAILASLKAAGMSDADIQTSTYTIMPEYYYPQNGPPVLNDYKTVNGLKLTIHNILKVGSFIDTASNAGATRVDNIQFELSDDQSSKMRQIVLANAGANAKLKALSIAQSMGLNLGKVKSVIEVSYNVVPYVFAVQKAEQPPTPIQPGNVEVSAQVTVTYKI
jgi:hypothetical protein